MKKGGGGGGGADFYINELQYCTLYSTYMGFAAWDSLKKYTKWEMYGEGKRKGEFYDGGREGGRD